MYFATWNIKHFDNCFIVQTEESQVEKRIDLSQKYLNKLISYTAKYYMSFSG